MKNLFRVIIALISINMMLSAPQAYAQESLPVSNTMPERSNTKTLKHSIVIVPAGETFKVISMMPINSETGYTGQQIIMALNTDFYYEDKCVAPAGTAVSGVIIDVAKAKHGSINGKLMMRFTQLITPTGLEIPISAIIKTEDKSGILFGNNPIAQAALAEPSIQKRGSSISSLAGSGGGFVKSIWDKGENVNIPVNSSIELLLLQPITVNPEKYENK